MPRTSYGITTARKGSDFSGGNTYTASTDRHNWTEIRSSKTHRQAITTPRVTRAVSETHAQGLRRFAATGFGRGTGGYTRFRTPRNSRTRDIGVTHPQ